VPPRYAPRLAEGPVTQASPYEAAARSAHALMAVPREARRPAVTLTESKPWSARRDLLGSLASDTHFVVELERDAHATLRFGDDVNGLRPAPGTAFRATYRVGNGTAGNVGAGAIHHVVTSQSGIEAVRNPLAAIGGLNPESIEEARRAAPYAYRRRERAVTEAEYASVGRRHPDVQRAAAAFRWNGHGHTVFVSVDRFGGRPADEAFRADLVSFLDRFRMAGYDVRVDAPRFAALEIELFVCVCPDHFRAAVRAAVLERLSTRARPGGRPGFFHPDNFSFGDPVHLSALYAAVMEIEGVTSVTATVFQRRGRPDPAPLADGVLPMDRLEIARLDNDPNFVERGTLVLDLGGGK
jgi:predicted phage baseplate assembly protein